MQGVDVCLSLCWMNIRIRPIAVYYIGKETEARMLTEQLRLMQLSTYSMRRYFISCPHPVPSNTVLLFTTCYRKRPVKPILQFFYFSSWGPWVKSTLTADFITPILRRRGGGGPRGLLPSTSLWGLWLVPSDSRDYVVSVTEGRIKSGVMIFKWIAIIA